jgi:hypothetical protein
MTNELTEIICTIVRSELSEAAVKSVEVAEDVDHEGDDIFRVRIVLRQDAGTDTKKFLGLVRHLRSGLTAVNCDHFPIIDFVSEGDVRKTTREFA